jgi:hypothetical protein
LWRFGVVYQLPTTLSNAQNKATDAGTVIAATLLRVTVRSTIEALPETAYLVASKWSVNSTNVERI